MDGFIAFIADVLVFPIVFISVVAVWRLPAEKRWQVIAKGVVVALTALLIAKFMAQFYQGDRPFELLGLDPKASFLPNPGFPSDHTLLVFTASFVVWAGTRRHWLALFLFTLSTLVALGRVLALVHTPLDVIGGVACAMLAALLWYGPTFQQRFYVKS